MLFKNSLMLMASSEIKTNNSLLILFNMTVITYQDTKLPK